MTLQYQQKISSISQEVENGLNFIINHFDPTILHFPRRIMTKKLLEEQKIGQKIIYSKQDALSYFQDSNYIDCRINSFRYYSSNSAKEEKWNPDLIFIDIDKKDFKDNKNFEKAYSTTLENIKLNLNGEPTVMCSGNGCHIVQPIEAIDFENSRNETLLFINKEFGKEFDLFKEFLRFSKDFLSNNKADKANHPSFDSCLLRIPGSINGKCLDNRNKRLSGNVKVKIIKKWNGVRPIVPNEYLECFADYLIQKKIKEINESKENNNNSSYNYPNNNNNYSSYYEWIERLLQTPIEDYRKKTIELILVPYLVLIKKLSDEESFQIINEWLQKCNSLRKLDFDARARINAAIKNTHKKQIPPMKYNTLKNNYKDLYLLLIQKERKEVGEKRGG